MQKLVIIVAAGLALLAAPAVARVEKVTVHGPSLEHNLEGNSPDRTVFVMLPPGYDRSKARRYPTVYFLHGFQSTAEGTITWTKMEQHYEAAMAATRREFILVVPDNDTRFGGSMYSNSVTVGDFERFNAKDLVAWIDRHYRTIARRESRGLAGHSMGGYGTFRLGMKYPEVFSVLYAMNPCCLTPRPFTADEGRKYEDLTPEQVSKANFDTRANFAVAAAWSPNPGKPPFYADLATDKGELDPLVLAKWHANAPIAMLAQYVPAMRSMSGIGLDTGDKDFVHMDDLAMHAELQRFGIDHDWELYDGDHGNRVPQRLEKVVFPFFTRHLSFKNH
jgi:enterochelin esterase-like enzyme